MATQPNRRTKVVFGPFEYDDPSGNLRKYGTRLRLQGKPLQILSLLVNRPGQIVSSRRTAASLVGGHDFRRFRTRPQLSRQQVTSDAGRFGGPAAVRGDDSRAGDTDSSLPFSELPPKLFWRWPRPSPLRIEPKPGSGRSLAAICCGRRLWPYRGRRLLVGQAVRKSRSRRRKLTKFAVLPPAGFALEGAASRQSFALSPDGARMAFTAMDSSGAFSVFLRDFNSLEPRLVPGSEGAHTVFWPPDGRSLYLTAKGKLWRTPLEGDAHVLLADSPSFMFSGAWLSSRTNTARQLSGRVTLFLRQAAPLERLKEIYWWPQMLPDGEHVLYVRWDARAGRYRARVRSAW